MNTIRYGICDDDIATESTYNESEKEEGEDEKEGSVSTRF
jgi:hypothetical protein